MHVHTLLDTSTHTLQSKERKAYNPGPSKAPTTKTALVVTQPGPHPPQTPAHLLSTWCKDQQRSGNLFPLVFLVIHSASASFLLPL